jgi:hypothetical protein
MEEWFAFTIVAALVLAVGLLAQSRVRDARLAQFLVLALVVRIIGSTLRYEVLDAFYGGGGDSKLYFFFGRQYADRIRDLDFGFLLGDDTIDGRWWGAQFMKSLTGFVMFVIGDHVRAAFLVFACSAFVGVVLFVEAFGVSYGANRRPAFAKWLWFWPSVWFWPSSIGKESVLMLAIGLVVRAYVGRNGRPLWPMFAAGLLLAAAIRPHVAMIVALSALLAELVRQRPKKLPGNRVLPAIAALVLAGLSVQFGLRQLGLGDADLEGIEEYFENRAAHTEQGGSQISRVSGPLTVPMGLVNVLMRPFPWEARGLTALSSAEIWLLWLLVFNRRQRVRLAIHRWRENRFLVFAFPLGTSLALLYGIAFANLGIIARQRVVIFPFLLSLLAASERDASTQTLPRPVSAPRLLARTKRQSAELPARTRLG